MSRTVSRFQISTHYPIQPLINFIMIYAHLIIASACLKGSDLTKPWNFYYSSHSNPHATFGQSLFHSYLESSASYAMLRMLLIFLIATAISSKQEISFQNLRPKLIQHSYLWNSTWTMPYFINDANCAHTNWPLQQLSHHFWKLITLFPV